MLEDMGTESHIMPTPIDYLIDGDEAENDENYSNGVLERKKKMPMIFQWMKLSQHVPYTKVEETKKIRCDRDKWIENHTTTDEFNPRLTPDNKIRKDAEVDTGTQLQNAMPTTRNELINKRKMEGKANCKRSSVGLPSCKSGTVDGIKGNDFIVAFIVFSMFGLALGNSVPSSSDVRWDVDTPILFGTDVTLKLFIQTRISGFGNGTNTWRGGPNNRLLVFDNVSSDESKYDTQIILNDEESVYMLIIKNFSDTDLHCQYIYQQGFYQYNKSLTLNDNLFERHPNNNTIHQFLYIEDNAVFGLVELDAVYPSPFCIFSYDSTLIHEGDIFRNETNTSIANLRVAYSFNFSVISYHNCGNVTLMCSIGTFNMSKVFNVQNCTDKIQKRKRTTEIYKNYILIVSVPVVILLITLTKWMVGVKIQKRQNERGYPDQQNKEEDELQFLQNKEAKTKEDALLDNAV